jgi:hypothetical protein
MASKILSQFGILDGMVPSWTKLLLWTTSSQAQLQSQENLHRNDMTYFASKVNLFVVKDFF